MAGYNPYANYGGYEIPQSKLDGSMLKIFRLARCWDKCHACLDNADPMKLNTVLDAIWFELSADATPEQEENIDKLDKQIASARRNKNITGIWYFVKKKWKYLFQVEKVQGLGKRYIDPHEDDLD